MGLPKLKAKVSHAVTVGEYLARERDAFERSEYIDGEVYQMAGESEAHGDISVNLVRELSTQLKGKTVEFARKKPRSNPAGSRRRYRIPPKGCSRILTFR